MRISIQLLFNHYDNEVVTFWMSKNNNEVAIPIRFYYPLLLNQQRIVLTHDSDFGTLVIADGKPFIGIIYLKTGHILPEFTSQSLEAIFNEIDYIENPFIIVAKHNGMTTKVRIRQF